MCLSADVLLKAYGNTAKIAIYNVNVWQRLWQDEHSLILVRDANVRDSSVETQTYFQLNNGGICLVHYTVSNKMK
jgi:hypothetical protein